MKLLQAEAGVNDGKAGLLSAAGLFSKAGVFDKKSESFNILELDPYLLFDARESMLGTLENPTLDLDPATPSTLDVITATRSGTATYTDANGNIATAAADTVRVDHVDGVPMILVEPSATNLVTNSNSSNLNFALDDVSMTYNVTGSPDGETNGILFEQTGNNANDSAYNYGLPNTDGAYSYSIFIKAADSSLVRFRSDNGTILVQDFNPQTMTSGTLAGGLNLKFEDYGNGWFRVSFTRTLSSAPYNRFQIYPDRNNTQKGLHIFGLQVESGSTVATSYIPTSGSTVTRQADDLVISGSEFTDFFSTTENTFYCEFDPRPSDETQFLLCSQATSARFIYQPPSNNSWYIYDGTSSSVFGTESSTGLQRAAATFDGTSKEASLNGGGENTSSHNGNLLNVPTELRIGKAYYGGGYLNGHIKRVIWWPYSSDRL